MNVPNIDMMIGGFECPVTALPFGALKSDWARLLLLRRALPQESTLRLKLARLFRILIVAYHQTEERFDVRSISTISTSASTVPDSDNSTRTKKLEPVTNAKETHEIPESFTPTTVLGTEEFINAGKIERTVARWNVTREDASVGMPTDGSTTIVPSPVGSGTFRSTSYRIDVEEKKTEKSSVTSPMGSNVTIEEQQLAEKLTNYWNNDTNNRGSRKGLVAMQTGRTIVKSIVTVDNSTFNRTTTKNETVDYFGRDLDTNNFAIRKPNVATQDRDDNVDKVKSLSSSFPIIIDTPVTTASVKYPSGSMKVEVTERGVFTSDAAEIVKTDLPKMRARGDSPSVFHVPVNFEMQKENTVDVDEESKHATARYRDSTGSNFTEFANISSPEMSDVKSTTKRSHIYTNRIPGNDVAPLTESFPRKHSNRRKNGIFQVFVELPWSLVNSTDQRNKIRKPSISWKPPANKKFWKYIVVSRNVTRTTPVVPRSTTKLTDRTEETNRWSSERPAGSSKRGSSYTNLEKNFQWFYNVRQESKDQRVRYNKLPRR